MPVGGLYDFDGLYRFKRKFGPVQEPRYLAYPSRGVLVRALILLALDRIALSGPPTQT